MKIEIYKKKLKFVFTANTSRGSYRDKEIYILKIIDKDKVGFGECAPLYDLSFDYDSNYEKNVIDICHDTEQKGFIDYSLHKNFPSILMGLETAFMQLKHNSLKFYDNDFCNGNEGILINGLIWMGDIDLMKERLYKKIEEGFSCIKIKIGALDFESEYKLIKIIRDEFPLKKLTIRLDANCAYDFDKALYVLDKLAPLDIHSIEQPLKVKRYEESKKLVELSPIKIALDEDLIGLYDIDAKRYCLEKIKPNFIILKPTLHGGFKGCDEWLALADEMNIDYWITSALESNIGLNAIAQYASTKNITIPQGLGTGLLFSNNIDYGLYIKSEKLFFDQDFNVDFDMYLKGLEKIC